MEWARAGYTARKVSVFDVVEGFDDKFRSTSLRNGIAIPKNLTNDRRPAQDFRGIKARDANTAKTIVIKWYSLYFVSRWVQGK
jgi:hypothetical protein